MPSVDFGVQRVMRELIPVDPSPIPHLCADEDGPVSENICDGSDASEGRFYGFHQACANEAGVEGTHGGNLAVHG